MPILNLAPIVGTAPNKKQGTITANGEYQILLDINKVYEFVLSNGSASASASWYTSTGFVRVDGEKLEFQKTLIASIIYNEANIFINAYNLQAGEKIEVQLKEF